MKAHERNGLIVGLLLGLWVAWTNWPEETVGAATYARASASVIAAMGVCWLIAKAMSRQSSK